MWVLDLFGNQLLRFQEVKSKHITIFSEFSNSEVNEYYFTSSHLDGINEIDGYRAFYRAKALIRILNGIFLLTNSPQIIYNEQFIHYWDGVYDGNRTRSYPIILEDNDLEYEELENPFQWKPTHCQGNEESERMTDIFDLTVEDKLIKEVIILFNLAKSDLLYMLINISKIIEHIEYDLSKCSEDKNDLSENYQEAYNFLNMANFPTLLIHGMVRVY